MCMIPCEKLGEDRGGLSQEKLVICLPTLLFHNLKLIYELKEKHEEREQLWVNQSHFMRILMYY